MKEQRTILSIYSISRFSNSKNKQIFIESIRYYLRILHHCDWTIYRAPVLRPEVPARVPVPFKWRRESGECHCRRTVSCLLGAPVKTIVSTQLTHGWPVQAGARGRASCSCNDDRRGPWLHPGHIRVDDDASSGGARGKQDAHGQTSTTRPRPWIRRYAWYFHEKSLIQ